MKYDDGRRRGRDGAVRREVRRRGARAARRRLLDRAVRRHPRAPRRRHRPVQDRERRRHRRRRAPHRGGDRRGRARLRGRRRTTCCATSRASLQGDARRRRGQGAAAGRAQPAPREGDRAAQGQARERAGARPRGGRRDDRRREGRRHAASTARTPRRCEMPWTSSRTSSAARSSCSVRSTPTARSLLVAGVTADLDRQGQGGRTRELVAQQVGGKGGGRPDLAQAGGTEPENLDAALASVAAGCASTRLSGSALDIDAAHLRSADFASTAVSSHMRRLAICGWSLLALASTTR